MALLDKNQIMEIIPHRDPFLLIDEVEELEIGKRVVAKKFIAPDSFWFRGHFPEHPVTPGVLIVEMLAQAGADPVAGSARLSDLLRRPRVSYALLAPFDPDRPALSRAVTEAVEIRLKYEGYLRREQKQVE